MNRFAKIGDTAEPCGVPRSCVSSVPSRRCSGAGSHRPHIQHHPILVGVSPDSLDHQVVVHGVEELADVQIKHPPAGFPAPLPACSDRIQRRTIRAVTVGVGMDSGSTRLSNSIATTVCATLSATVGTPSVRTRLRISGSPPPERVTESTSPMTSDSTPGRDCSSGRFRTPRWNAHPLRQHPCWPSPCDTPRALPISKSRTASSTTSVDSSSSSQLSLVDCITNPNGPAPSLHAHYRRFTTTTSRSASMSRIGTQRLTVSAARRAPSRHHQGASSGACLPTFHAKAADQTHVASMPDAAWPEIGNTRQTHPDTKKKPRFRCHLYPFR